MACIKYYSGITCDSRIYTSLYIIILYTTSQCLTTTSAQTYIMKLWRHNIIIILLCTPATEMMKNMTQVNK